MSPTRSQSVPLADLCQRHRRFPICVDLQYWLLDEGRIVKTGFGRTVNLSSSGVLFEADEALPSGRAINLALAWPVRLDNKVGLKLRIIGRTVRKEYNCTAVQILHHAFRTRRLPVWQPDDRARGQTPALELPPASQLAAALWSSPPRRR